MCARTTPMPDSGLVSCSGTGSHSLGATELLTDVIAYLVTLGHGQELTLVNPRQVLRVGWYGIGWAHANGVGGAPPLITWWKWLDFDGEDTFSLGPNVGLYTYADTLFWYAMPGSAFSIQAYW